MQKMGACAILLQSTKYLILLYKKQKKTLGNDVDGNPRIRSFR